MLFTDLPTARDSTFKLPSSVTLNDQKPSLFLEDLGDSGVPLHKLEKSVPWDEGREAAGCALQARSTSN